MTEARSILRLAWSLAIAFAMTLVLLFILILLIDSGYDKALVHLCGGFFFFLRENLTKLSTDYPANPNTPRNMKPLASGILETQGLTAILEATDAMLIAADVKLAGNEKIGAAYVTVVISGDVAAVSAAIADGKQAVGSLGKVIAAHVIALPHDELIALLPK